MAREEEEEGDGEEEEMETLSAVQSITAPVSLGKKKNFSKLKQRGST